MQAKREKEIRRIVRAQVADALERDLKGDERVMKEAWEECVTSEEQAIAESELSAIIELIREGDA